MAHGGEAAEGRVRALGGRGALPPWLLDLLGRIEVEFAAVMAHGGEATKSRSWALRGVLRSVRFRLAAHMSPI